MSYQALEERIGEWAQGREDLPYVLVVGSRARVNPGPDEWSDLDLVFFSRDPGRYTQAADWLDEFGQVEMAHLFADGAHPEWQVFYRGGLKADIFLYPIKEGSLEALLEGFPYQDVLLRGARLLGDKEALPLHPGQPRHLPTPARLQEHLKEMLFAEMRAGRLNARGETWQAYRQLNCNLHALLLTLVEWQALAATGEVVDVWYAGRYLKRWASASVQHRLAETFSLYQAADIWRALLACHDLVADLGRALAASLQASYPEQEEAFTRCWLVEVAGGDGKTRGYGDTATR